MGLISYEQLEDGFVASANLWNERFGKLYGEFNGNIDSANLKNGAVTREKIANNAVNKDKLDMSLYIDENGWTVSDMGGIKSYSRQLTVTGSGGGSNNNATGKVINGNGNRDNLGNFPAPIGRTVNNLSVVATWFGNYTGHLVVAAEARGDQIHVEGGNIWPNSLAFEGKVNIQATELL